MSFNAAGTYIAPTGSTTAFAGQTIASATWNAIFTDLTSAINTTVELFRVLDADAAGTNVNTAQPWFPSTGGVTLLAATSYFMEGLLVTVRVSGTVSHTVGMSFGGAATLTGIAYDAKASNAATNALATVVEITASVASNITVTAANTDPGENVRLFCKGIVRVLGSGTFIPQFTYSVAPGGVPTIKAGSYFRLKQTGANTVTSNGTWA